MGLLKSHHIQALVDVRRYPGSKRHPHFNSEALSDALAKAEIEYIHLPELGGRRRPVPNSPNTAWENEMFRGYADHMMTPEFRSGIEKLMKTGSKKRTVIMCAEALWWQCHRSLVADYLKAHGARVHHILGDEKVEEHPYTSPARIVEGKLTYAPESAPLEFHFS